MVIASGTKDIVEKKLIFFYLSIYSHHNPDFARMAVNTFKRHYLEKYPPDRETEKYKGYTLESLNKIKAEIGAK